MSEELKERPVLFSGPMVRAILKGRKTQTRRVVKLGDSGRPVRDGKSWHIEDPECVKACPYGQVGDRLWVRETWACLNSKVRHGSCIAYRADTPDGERVRCDAPWRPSIHMPRWASRITLEITGVHVERLQNMSISDVWLEGITQRSYFDDDYFHSPIEDFRGLWDSLNAPRGHGWATNPWVWAVSFKKEPTP